MCTDHKWVAPPSMLLHTSTLLHHCSRRMRAQRSCQQHLTPCDDLQAARGDLVTLHKRDLERYIDAETQDLYDHMKRLHSQPKPPDCDCEAEEAEIENMKLKLQIMHDNMGRQPRERPHADPAPSDFLTSLWNRYAPLQMAALLVHAAAPRAAVPIV